MIWLIGGQREKINQKIGANAINLWEAKTLTYEEFVNKSSEHYMDMVRLIDIKLKYRMQFTEEEKEIKDHIMEFQHQTKLNELRDKFEKCLDIDNLS
jgi:hypothetical protein